MATELATDLADSIREDFRDLTDAADRLRILVPGHGRLPPGPQSGIDSALCTLTLIAEMLEGGTLIFTADEKAPNAYAALKTTLLQEGE